MGQTSQDGRLRACPACVAQQAGDALQALTNLRQQMTLDRITMTSLQLQLADALVNISTEITLLGSFSNG